MGRNEPAIFTRESSGDRVFPKQNEYFLINLQGIGIDYFTYQLVYSKMYNATLQNSSLTWHELDLSTV